MIKVLFICHGNICRSPMAEFIFKKLVEDRNLSDKYYSESKATSNEEIGNGIYPPAKKELERHGILYDKNKTASKVVLSDYDKFDYIICMDKNNIYNINRIFNKMDKVHLLGDYSFHRDVSDPWYTRNFKKCYNDLYIGINAFINYLEE